MNEILSIKLNQENARKALPVPSIAYAALSEPSTLRGAFQTGHPLQRKAWVLKLFDRRETV